MPQYLYSGRNATGAAVHSTLEAPDELAAARRLREQGILPLSIRPESPLLPWLERQLWRRAPGTRELAVLWRHLHQMLRAGLPLVTALRLKETDRTAPGLATFLRAIRGDVEGGSSFADALRRHKAGLAPAAVEMIAAGEVGGNLPAVLERLADQADKEERVRGKLRSALTYPTLVLILSLVAIGLMIAYVVPQFADIYSDLEQELPLSTQFLLATSQLLANHLILLLGGGAATVVGVSALARSGPGRRQLDRLWLRLPLFGPLLRQRGSARVCRTLSGLLGSTVPVLTALELAGSSAGNAVLGLAVLRVRSAVQQGGDLSSALRAAPELPPLLAEFAAVGQETGTVPEMLERAAHWLDEDVERATERLTATVEPLLTLFLTALVGAVVLMILTPIFTLWNTVQ